MNNAYHAQAHSEQAMRALLRLLNSDNRTERATLYDLARFHQQHARQHARQAMIERNAVDAPVSSPVAVRRRTRR